MLTILVYGWFFFINFLALIFGVIVYYHFKKFSIIKDLGGEKILIIYFLGLILIFLMSSSFLILTFRS